MSRPSGSSPHRSMRSFLALVNQVAPYYCAMSHLQPFRELLKKKTPWYWDGLLQKLFEESREHISMKVVEGIELFDKTRWTAVSTDWFKMGVGYFLSQKHAIAWRSHRPAVLKVGKCAWWGHLSTALPSLTNHRGRVLGGGQCLPQDQVLHPGL